MNTMLLSLRCNPVDEETVQISPIERGCDFFETSLFAYSEFVDANWASFPDDERIYYDFVIADPNNDYYNFDDNGVFVGPWWRFELPERAFDVRYDLRAETEAHLTANAFSNNFLNRVQWWAWVSGFMHFEIPPNPGIPLNPASNDQLALDANNDLIVVGAKPLHALAPDGGIRNDYYNSDTVIMSRSIEVDGGDDPPTVVVAFPTLYWVDGGRLEVSGAADFRDGDDLAWSASIECTITRL